jgi:L-lactate dehydrogenase
VPTKVSIIGVGRVGATTAFHLTTQGVADELVLVNRTHETAVGEAMDLTHATGFMERPIRVRAGQVEDTAESDIVVVTSSVPHPPDKPDRLLLAEGNARLMADLLPRLAHLSPTAIFIMVTNPVDVMTYLALQLTGLEPRQVIGTGTLIDSARYRSLLSQHWGVHPEDIRAYILGEHGDSQVRAQSVALTGGERLPDSEYAEQAFRETIAGGYEIARRKGYTNFAIAMAVGLMVESILRDSRRTMPVSTVINGYCGVHDVCLSVPVVLGRSGVTRRFEPLLDESEQAAFRQSARIVRGAIERCLSAIEL